MNFTLDTGRLILFILASAAGVSAQAGTCRDFVLVGPEGILRHNEVYEFTTKAGSSAALKEFTVTWSTSHGAIEPTKDTIRATYRPTTDDSGRTVTISALLKSATQQCELTEDFQVEPRSVDRFPFVNLNSVEMFKAELDGSMTRINLVLEGNPNLTPVFEFSFNENSSRAYKLSRLKLMLNFFRYRRYSTRLIWVKLLPDGIRDSFELNFASPLDVKTLQITTFRLSDLPSKLNSLFRNKKV